MSLQKTVYYFVLCGGWATFLAWAVTAAAGLHVVESDILFAGVLGGMSGLLIAAALGTFDSLLHTSPNHRIARILAGLLFGFIFGILGGVVCDVLTKISPALRFAGWMILGTVLGAA